MKRFVCYYFSGDNLERGTVRIMAASRTEAIAIFDSTQPYDMLIHMEEIELSKRNLVLN